MASIKDVAEKAGVSISTVSHVIHGTKYVSEPLRKKVNKVIEETSFQLDGLASSVKSKRTHNVGVLLPEITMIFFPDVLEGIDSAAKERGYKLFFLSTGYDFEAEKENLRFLKSSWVDGILLDSCCRQPDMPEYLTCLTHNIPSKNVPVVTLESSFHSKQVGFVGIDHVQYTKMAIQHLVSLGHRDIAIMGGPDYLPLSADNLQGYREALQEAGLPVKEENYLQGDYLPVSGYDAVKKAFTQGQKPTWTALFCANDQMAIGAVKAALNLGIKIPQHLAIMGFDNVFPGSLIEPQLTTIDVPRFDMGYRALNLLIDKIEGQPVKENEIWLPCELIVRKSTVEAAKNDWVLTGW